MECVHVVSLITLDRSQRRRFSGCFHFLLFGCLRNQVCFKPWIAPSSKTYINKQRANTKPTNWYILIDMQTFLVKFGDIPFKYLSISISYHEHSWTMSLESNRENQCYRATWLVVPAVQVVQLGEQLPGNIRRYKSRICKVNLWRGCWAWHFHQTALTSKGAE